MTKAGFCAIVGRPSSGKSTLLNSLCGHHVSIVSPIPQTTRNKVRGVYTARPDGSDASGADITSAGASARDASGSEDQLRQIVFVDTPGFHQSERKLNQYLRGLLSSALEDIDAVLYVVDITRPVGPEEETLAGILAKSDLPVLVALNKVDVAHALRREYEVFIRRELPRSPIFWTSAREGSGTADLIRDLTTHMPEAELLYPQEFYTDQDPAFRIAELIREQAISHTREELPHALYVEVADMEVREAKAAASSQTSSREDGPRDTLWIRAFIVVERESQKGIVVGRGGGQIKEIRVTSQQRLAELFDYRIHLDLRVKVEAKWRRNDGTLARLLH